MASALEQKLHRLLLLVPYVMANQGARVDEVCERFDITHRQLADDLKLLFVCGLPGYGPGDLIDASVEGDRVWIRMADYFHRPLALTPAEALLLYTGAKAIKSSGHSTSVLDSAMKKLEGVLGAEVLDRVAIEIEGGGPLGTLRDALGGARRIHLSYYAYSKDEFTERDVDPWALFAAAGHWYLVGWCHRVNDERIFRADRIIDVQILEEPASAPAHMDLSRYSEVYVEAADSTEVVIDLDQQAARWITENYPVTRSEKLSGGRLRVRLTTGATAWLERLLLRLGPAAHVVEPRELAERTQQLAARLLERYETQPMT